jgi:uncharacterized membrane protein YfcA
MTSLLLVAAAGLVAGTMNALAGGGSFVTLPALIAAGVPSVAANASSTVALLPGSAASAWAYRAGLGSVAGIALGPLLITTVAGSALGAYLLLTTPAKAFDLVLPWLLLTALLALAFGRDLGDRLRKSWHIGRFEMLLVQFALGIYSGYFGGAVGIMMLAVWGVLDSRELKELNAPRTLIVTAANVVAALAFIVTHMVRWPQTLAMLVAATVGGYAGAQIGRHSSAHVVRLGTLALTAGITLAFFARAYLAKPL